MADAKDVLKVEFHRNFFDGSLTSMLIGRIDVGMGKGDMIRIGLLPSGIHLFVSQRVHDSYIHVIEGDNYAI